MSDGMGHGASDFGGTFHGDVFDAFGGADDLEDVFEWFWW